MTQLDPSKRGHEHRRFAAAVQTEHADDFAPINRQKDPRTNLQKQPGSFVAASLERDAPAVLSELNQKDTAAAALLMPDLYDLHQMMTTVPKNMSGKELTFTESNEGGPGYLTRGSGPCQFCVNDHWKFQKGCPCGKTDEKQYTIRFLDKVTAAMIANSAVAATPNAWREEAKNADP